MLVALVPFLGWINWFNNIFIAFGWVFGLVAVIRNTKNNIAIAGLIICTIVLIIGTTRLIAGGGII